MPALFVPPVVESYYVFCGYMAHALVFVKIYVVQCSEHFILKVETSVCL
jgi:hypothetical protein